MDSLIHLALIWVSVYFAVIVAKWTRLTPVLYYLAFGAIMVNVGLLPEVSGEFLRGLAELGIIIIMFALGFEERTDNFLAGIKKSWAIALFGAIAPFIAAYWVTWIFFESREIALLSGLTMTATAVSLTMVSLKSEGLQRSRAATLIMTSAVLDDIASLALVAVVIPLATGSADFEFVSILTILAKALLFFLFIVILGGWLLPPNRLPWLKKIPILGRYGIGDILRFADGQHAVLAILLLALIVGLIAHAFGLHPAIGAYMAGLILKEEYFVLERKEKFYDRTKSVVDIAAFSVIGPIFFVDLGAKIIFDWNIFVSVIPETVALTSAVILAQIISAATAARSTAGMNWSQGLMVGFGMLGRAELAFVVMNIAYVQHSIFTTEVFYTLMFTAFWLNVAVPLTIMAWKPYYQRSEQGAA